jgi:putative FmdB family regulatory protein
MTYEYICQACGHQWEAQQSIKEDPLKDCPSCGQPQAKRQISQGPGFILKGGGWYSDLYSSTGAKKSDSGGGSSGGSSGSD